MGIGIGWALYKVWHILLSAAPRLTDTLGVVGTIVVAMFFCAITIGVSSWGGATAIGGAESMKAYMAEMLAKEESALSQAWQNVLTENSMIEAVSSAESQMSSLAVMEAQGNLTGKRGDGPMVNLLKATAANYTKLHKHLEEQSQAAISGHEKGTKLLAQMHKDIISDTDSFSQHATEVQSIIAELSDYRLSGFAPEGGIESDRHCIWSGQQPDDQRRRGKINDTISDRAQQIKAQRVPVTVPGYQPINKRMAAWEYSRPAIGGWICAICLDIVPLLVFVFLLITCKTEMLPPVSGDTRWQLNPSQLRHG